MLSRRTNMFQKREIVSPGTFRDNCLEEVVPILEGKALNCHVGGRGNGQHSNEGGAGDSNEGYGKG